MSDVRPRYTAHLLVAFADLTNFTAMSRVVSDTELAEFLDQHYTRVTELVEGAGGQVVKFIGDAALVVFLEAKLEEGMNALLALKVQTDAWLRQVAPRSRLIVKAHFGPVVAGGIGPRRDFDVIGETVNITARLESDGFAISPQAFRKLSPTLRRRFRKHTPPITYALNWTQRGDKPDPATDLEAELPED